MDIAGKASCLSKIAFLPRVQPCMPCFSDSTYSLGQRSSIQSTNLPGQAFTCSKIQKKREGEDRTEDRKVAAASSLANVIRWQYQREEVRSLTTRRIKTTVPETY